MAALIDMHCHFGFASNPVQLAEELAQRHSAALCATVTPYEYLTLRKKLPAEGSARLALGIHPWWLAEERCSTSDVESFASLAKDARFIGEIGLDFSTRFAGSAMSQQIALDRMLGACMQGTGRKVISLHSVRAEDELLEMLERHGCLSRHACIFHWFSGSSESLRKAIQLGCYFSVGPRMLATKRGREYAKAIPAKRLLLETDWPSRAAGACAIEEQQALLGEALSVLEGLRKENVAELVGKTSLELLGL